jgi:hypothetical protein
MFRKIDIDVMTVIDSKDIERDSRYVDAICVNATPPENPRSVPLFLIPL